METKSEVLVSPASNKKLKQTRLPFPIFSPGASSKTPKPGVTDSNSKKRRLSTNPDDEKPSAKVKILESGNKVVPKKSTVPDVVAEIDLLSDDEQENDASKATTANNLVCDADATGKHKLDDEQSSQDESRIKIKLPFGHKAKKVKLTPLKKSKKQKKVAKTKAADDDNDDVVIVDDEVKELPTEVVHSASILTEEDCNGFDETSLEAKSEEVQKTIEALRDTHASPDQPTTTTTRSEASNDSTKTDPTLTCPESMISTTQSIPSVVSSPSVSDNEAKPVVQKKIEIKTPKSHKKLTEAEKAERQKRLEDERLQRQKEKDDKKRKEREEREAQRQKEREEKEAQRLKEKEAREAQRLKEKMERDEKLRKEKEEKDALKQKEREERERKKNAEIEAKNNEKRKDEDNKRKSAAMFQKFFIKKAESNETKPAEEDSSKESTDLVDGLRFMPFQVKENMRLAPPTRKVLSDDQKCAFDKVFNTSLDKGQLYLSSIKTPSYKKGKSESTWPLDDDDSQDVIMIDPTGIEHNYELEGHKKTQRYRAKFLKFAENRRPAYYGTWRKKSKVIGPRKPFGQEQILDYEVDSDLEWEEEEPGESLDGSDDEKDKDDAEDDYEVDNEFFVPHGHLSDEELEHEDEIAEDNTPEAQKARLKIMQQEFAAEMKKKTEKIKPRLIGCVWVKNNANESDACSSIVWEMLQARGMLLDNPITMNLDDPLDDATEKANASTVVTGPKKSRITEDAMPDLIRLVHGNPNSRKFLVDEFTAFRNKHFGELENFNEFSMVGSKIKEIAVYRPGTEADGTMNKVFAWFVKDEILEKYDLKDRITLPNTSWEYILKPKKEVPNLNKEAGTPSSSRKIWTVTEEAMPDLVRLVHGNTHSRKFLIEEFAAFRKATYGNEDNFHEFSYVGSRIKRIAVWKQWPADNGPMHLKSSWVVNEDVLEKYDLKDLPLPNTWQYNIDPASYKSKPKKFVPKRLDVEPAKETEVVEPKPVSSTPSIEKFAVVLSVEDKKKQFEKITPPANEPVASTSRAAPSQPAAKKRVQLLMSGPRGQALPETKKNSLIDKFLNKGTAKSTAPINVDANDDVMVID